MSEDKQKVAIKIEGVYKDFHLPHEVSDNLKQRILHPLKRSTIEKQHALKDISFEINKGDFFGIVGRNGSGKSTLLKIIAQIYAPTKGTVEVSGSLTPFIELGVGFNPELSGRDNVFLNGAMLGFSRKEMEEMYDEIVEFAELEQFMDQKLKNYSSGMQVRLAFSVAIRSKSDILLLDEVLAVGDAVFQQKCFKYFKQLKKDRRTVVFVSHDMASIKKYCNRCILIKDSVLAMKGSPLDIGNRYLIDTGEAIASEEEKILNKSKSNPTSLPAKIKSIKLTNIPSTYQGKDTLVLEIRCKTNKRVGLMPAISIIKSPEMLSVAEINYGKLVRANKDEEYEFTYSLDTSFLNGGEYLINHCLLGEDNQLLVAGDKVLSFNIGDRGKQYGGVVKLLGKWS